MPEIAIDACVFVHLLNPQNNTQSHIDLLLTKLMCDEFVLLIDSTGKISKDYETQIIPIIRNSNDTGIKLQLLRYWMQRERRVSVDLDKNDGLMQAITGIIHEVSENADRAFVYIACRQGALLVSNDGIHILGRRSNLLRNTRRLRASSSNIFSSLEAKEHFLP